MVNISRVNEKLIPREIFVAGLALCLLNCVVLILVHVELNSVSVGLATNAASPNKVIPTGHMLV